MFEGAQQAYTGMLEGMNRQSSRQIANASQDIRELSDEVIRLKRKTVALGQDRDAILAELAEARAVLQARDDADAAEVAAWRKEHPVSHMHDVVSTLSSGRPMRRNLSIWIAAFDAAARKLGIAKPEAHRIS